MQQVSKDCLDMQIVQESCMRDMSLFLHDSCMHNLAHILKNCARKGTYRVHVPSKSCMQDSCTILYDLASSFLLGDTSFAILYHVTESFDFTFPFTNLF